jgi:hypothetical protein
MGMLAPLSLVLLLLLPVVVAMYLLKLRRTEQQVSSVYLWQRMVRDVEANAPWQRLRRNLLLLLQLLMMLFLILALARPFSYVEGSGSRSTILIIDTSASMAARDIQPNRLEAAKQQARRIIGGLPDDARVTVIAAGEGAEVRVSSSQDPRQVDLAIDSLQVQPGGSRMEEALELASAIAARQPETEMVVLSDGNVDLPERLAVSGQVRYLPVGTQDDNQAISLLSIERNLEGLTAFAQVTNYAAVGAEPQQRRISFFADGQLVQAFDLELEPDSQQAVLAPDLPISAAMIEARLDGQDMLSLDDRAWVINRPVQPVQVTLVSQGNRFLETGLSLLPGVALTSILPEDWEVATGPASDEQTGSRLTIFDGHVPLTRTLPAENMLFIGPLTSSEFFTITGSIENPVFGAAEAADPLLDDISDLRSINLLDAARIPLPDWARPVIVGETSDGQFPLLFRGEPGGQRIAVLTFDLRRSDLPLQVAFPILLSNLLDWLAPAEISLPAEAAPGATLSFQAPAAAENLRLAWPDGRLQPLDSQAGRVSSPPLDQLGVYQVQWGEGQQAAFAVNLFSPQESKISPAGELALSAVEAGSDAVDGQQARREWWRPLAWIALLLIMLEWLVYQRANLQRLIDQARNRFRPDDQAPSRPSTRVSR